MGKYKNKPTGKYRSKLEAFTADCLNANNIPFGYETQKIELVPGFEASIDTFENGILKPRKVRSITYTPDFVGKDWIIEVKGRKTVDFMLKWKLFKKYLTDNNLPYKLYLLSNQKQIKHVTHSLGTTHR